MKNKAMICALTALLCLSLAPLKGRAVGEAVSEKGSRALSGESAEVAGRERAMSLYIVAGAVLAIWLGVSAYLLKIDRGISRLEKKIHE